MVRHPKPEMLKPCAPLATYHPAPRPARSRSDLPGLISRIAAEPGPEEAELIAALQRVLFGDSAPAARPMRRVRF